MLMQIIDTNRARQQRARELNMRTGSKMFPVLTQDEMLAWVTERLNGARRQSEVADPSVLLLPELDKELVERAIRENPDSIKLFGAELEVAYKNSWGDQLSEPKITLGDLSDKWPELPNEGVRLPGGRTLEVSVKVGWYSLSNTDIPTLKKELRDELNREQWENWSDKPEIIIPDPTEWEAIAPFKVAVYGECTVTGEELKAYGTIVPKSYRYDDDPYFEIRWFRSLVEAHNEADASAYRLCELYDELAEKRETEKATAEAEEAKSQLAELANHDDWYQLDYELRQSAHEKTSYYSSIPREKTACLEWAKETRELTEKVNEALELIIRLRTEAEEARRQARESLIATLNTHLGNCPLCGQHIEWSDELVERGLLNDYDRPCSCSPYKSATRAIQLVEAGYEGETVNCDNRIATVLCRLEVDGKPAISICLYDKYGGWNIGWAVDKSTLFASINAQMVEVMKISSPPRATIVDVTRRRSQQDETPTAPPQGEALSADALQALFGGGVSNSLDNRQNRRSRGKKRRR